MATLTEIEFNYNKAMAQVSALNSLAKNLKKVGDNQLNDCMREVNSNWKSENATNYVAKGQKLKDKITNTAGDISTVAQTLSTMAENIRTAEINSINIIQTDSNK